MQRYIFTGAPGSGKTTLINELARHGYTVIPEAATDLIAAEQLKGNLQPWSAPQFMDKIIKLQQARQVAGSLSDSPVQLFDRSPPCTLALSKFLGFPISSVINDEIARITAENIYSPQVFFIENLGNCQQTAIRQISFAYALKFEQIHLEVYQSLSYSCIRIPPLPLKQRVNLLLKLLS
jgi:predicted ATPase